ncbi:hypothetical protein ACTMU2_19675 [Cupriavidus basilensis]
MRRSASSTWSPISAPVPPTPRLRFAVRDADRAALALRLAALPARAVANITIVLHPAPPHHRAAGPRSTLRRWRGSSRWRRGRWYP